jgi:hypothetical protein
MKNKKSPPQKKYLKKIAPQVAFVLPLSTVD